jgi:hypothetical protein
MFQKITFMVSREFFHRRFCLKQLGFYQFSLPLICRIFQFPEFLFFCLTPNFLC